MDIQCCVCGLVKSEQGWRRVWGVLTGASHTYCPRCAFAARAELSFPATTRKASGARRALPGRPSASMKASRYYTTTASDSTF